MALDQEYIDTIKDPEIKALATLLMVLLPLDDKARARVLVYTKAWCADEAARRGEG